MWSSAVEIRYSLSIINPRIICHHSRKSKRIGARGRHLFLLAVSLTKRQQMSPWSITSIIWHCPVTQAIRVLNIDAIQSASSQVVVLGVNPVSLPCREPATHAGVYPPLPAFSFRFLCLTLPTGAWYGNGLRFAGVILKISDSSRQSFCSAQATLDWNFSASLLSSRNQFNNYEWITSQNTSSLGLHFQYWNQ